MLSSFQHAQLLLTASTGSATQLLSSELLWAPARKTILTPDNALATLRLVKGYINSSFKKDETIATQSKQIHL